MRKITAIIDNGQPYPEDHSLYFVEIDADKLDQFQVLLSISSKDDHTVIGVADKLKWLVKGATPMQRVEDFLSVHCFNDTTDKEWLKLDKRYRRWFLLRLARVSNDNGGTWLRLKSLK